MAQKIFSINSDENFCNINEIYQNKRITQNTKQIELGNIVPQNIITVKTLNTEYKL